MFRFVLNVAKYERYLSSHSTSSCRVRVFLGNSLPQNWHSDGSSLTAFSTARFLDADVLLISTRQLGQVANSSLSRASASTCVKQPAHIRCPLLHCNPRNSNDYMVVTHAVGRHRYACGHKHHLMNEWSL